MALDVEHLTWSNDGVKLLLGKSKTDKAGEGAEIMIVLGRHEGNLPCPNIAALVRCGRD